MRERRRRCGEARRRWEPGDSWNRRLRRAARAPASKRMSPGEPPRIWARSASSSPAASTCDDFEAWASSANLSGMGRASGLRVRVQGSGSGSGFRPQNKSLVIPNEAFFFAAEGSQSPPLMRVSVCSNGNRNTNPKETFRVSVRRSPGAHPRGRVTHTRDLNFCLTVVRLNVDGGHVFLVLRDNRAAILVRGGNHGVGKLGLVKS